MSQQISKKIPIPPTQTTYCYIRADKDHHDLEDLFGGKYIKSQDVWRFDKQKEQAVFEFLDCSSTESEEFDESDNDNGSPKKNEDDSFTKTAEKVTKINPLVQENGIPTLVPSTELLCPTPCGHLLHSKIPKTQRTKRDRLHRANSFNASDDSNDDCDSLDRDFRRQRISKTEATQASVNLKKK